MTIKWYDLGVLNDRISIPMTYLPFHNDFELLNAPYLNVIEPWCFYGLWRSPHLSQKLFFNQLQYQYRKTVIPKYPDRTFFLNLSNYFALRGKNIRYIFGSFHDERAGNNFIDRTHTFNAGSFRWAISLAIYLGFEKIDLIGCDYTAVPSRSFHWYEYGEGIFREQAGHEKSFLQAASEFADIRTVTLDGTSEVLPAITYKELFGVAPRYQENRELLSVKHLDAFRSFPGYTIDPIQLSAG